MDPETAGAVVPTLRYRDLGGAIDWLCNAFGFERHLIVPAGDGAVRYAQLTFNGGMIMLGPVEDSAFDQLMTQPTQIGGSETQICYLFVEDANAHYIRAKAAGAEIMLDIGDGRSNGRGYSCRDPEGHIWNFGTYNPWKPKSAKERRRGARRKARASRARRVALATVLLAFVTASTLFAGWIYGAVDISFADYLPTAVTDAAMGSDDGARGEPNPAADRTAKIAQDQLAAERSARQSAERTAGLTQEHLSRERRAKQLAERALQDAQDQLGREQAARAAAERSATETREQLTREQAARASVEGDAKGISEQVARERLTIEQEMRSQLSMVERASQQATEQLTHERAAREEAERVSRDANEQLTRERKARDAAERAVREAREQLAKERTVRKSPPRPAASSGNSQPFLFWQ